MKKQIESGWLVPPVVSLKLVRECPSPYEISGWDDVVTIAQAFIEMEDREHLIAIPMDARGKVLGIHTVAIGDSLSCIVTPREVFKAAILTNACSIVVAHNHPSGDPNPSKEDFLVTEKLFLAGNILGIELLDHVIVGAGQSHSMKRERTFNFAIGGAK